MLRQCSMCKKTREWKPKEGPPYYKVYRNIERIADICPDCGDKLFKQNNTNQTVEVKV